MCLRSLDLNLSVQHTDNVAGIDDEVMVGDVLDERYVLTEVVGRGGCGIVFRASDLNLQRDVAVKVLSGEGIKESGTLKKFEQESQILRRLHAQNTVFFYDCGETRQHLPYIVMEFVTGRLLKDILAEEGKLSPKRTVAILTQVFSALEEAHGYGFVHRDLKPGNIMLCERPGFPDAMVKVLDFGIAKIMSKGEINDPSKGELAGTPKYMPPEQFKNDPLTPSADLYSMGCIAYEMLTGIAPFEGDTLHVTIARHLMMTPPSLGPEIEKYPNLAACVFKLLEKQPEARFESAHKVLSVLEHWNEPELIPEMVGCRIKGDDEQKSIFDDDDENIVSGVEHSAVSKESPVPAERDGFSQTPVPVAHLRSAQETVLNRSGVSARELLLLREAGHITKSKERKLIYIASAILLVSIVIIFVVLMTASRKDADSSSEPSVAEEAVEETAEKTTGKRADDVLENGFDSALMESVLRHLSESELDAVAFGLLSSEDILHLDDPDNPESHDDEEREAPAVAEPNETRQVKVGEHHHKADKGTLKFKFTLKYSPSNARIGFLNAKGDCYNGVCKVETTSETTPARVLVSAKGYQPKTVILSKRVSTLKIDLKSKK